MSTFVLVHGAWQTAGTWDLLTPLLREVGHRVVVPLLTGMENDAGMTSDVRLQTHIDDVVDVLEREDLRRVTLVGHSYAGIVITGAADRVGERLQRLVYVDALVPRDGQCGLELLPDAVAQSFREHAEEGWLLRARPSHLDLWGLPPGEAREFVWSRRSDFSLRCFAERVALPADAASGLPRTYVAGVAEGYPAREVFRPFGEGAKREGWEYHELPTGHDCQAEMPEALASLLMRV